MIFCGFSRDFGVDCDWSVVFGEGEVERVREHQNATLPRWFLWGFL